MAEAIEAGTRGEATEATQRLGMSDLDMTQALDDTAATRAMQRTTVGPSPTRVHDTVPPAPVDSPRPPRRAGRRPARGNRRRWGTFLALLAAIAAVVIVAVALLSSSGNGGVDSVQQPDVQQQIDGLNDFIQSHTR